MWETNAFSLSQIHRSQPAERQPHPSAPPRKWPAAPGLLVDQPRPERHRSTLSRYCLVPTTWTVLSLQAHTCDDRSHSHISRATRDELLRHGAATWLLSPIERARHNGELPRDAFVHGVIRLKDTYAIRGFSARFGILADWGSDIFRLLISEITRRPMEDQR